MEADIFKNSAVISIKKFWNQNLAVMKGKYNPELGIYRVFWLVSCFINEFAEIESIKFKTTVAAEKK